MRKKILLILVLALLVPLLPPSLVKGAATTTPSAPVALSLVSAPAKIPADGGQYSTIVISLVDSTKLPSVTLTDTVVYLTSSLSNVGTLPSTATIKAGQPYALVNFTTTTTPGTTTITASSPGLSSATTQVSTFTPSGFPSQIKVFATPGQLLARPSDTGTITVELTDDTGLPAKATTDVPVLLFSSSVATVSPDSTNVTIKANQVLAFATFHTSFLPGKATVTASSSGFISGSDVVNVVGPAPLKLKILPQPDKILINSGGRVVVSLTDLSGNPARAPTAMSVTLTSSNLGVATVQNVTIPPGSIYTVASYSSTSVPGNATLTATSPGLQSSSSKIFTAPLLPPAVGDPLKVFLGPSTVLSDNQSYDSVLVGIVNSTGYPRAAVSDVTVQLTSSASSVGSVPASVTIPAGSTYATATFQSTFASGTTVITASASNLLPAQGELATYGPVPVMLSVLGNPLTLPADGGTYKALSIGLSDSSGGPAVAPEDVVVQLSSSKADVVSVDSQAVIRQGTLSTLVNVQTSVLAGSANITASAIGLGSGAALLTTVIPAPSKLAAYLAPANTFSATTKSSPLLVVQLQDDKGNPARARQTTGIVITSSNGQIMNKSVSVSIPAGLNYAKVLLSGAGAGVGTLTASSPGLGSSSVDVTLIPYPVTATLTAGKQVIYANQTTTLLFTASFLGKPISNATVNWLPNGGIATPTNGTSNTAGQVSTIFRPDGPGNANVTAVLSTQALGEFKFTTQITVLQVPPKPPLTVTEVIRTYLYYIIAAVAAVVVAVVYLYRLRSKKAKAELEAGFEAVS